MSRVEKTVIDLSFGIELDVSYIVCPAESDIGYSGDVEIVSAKISGLEIVLNKAQYAKVKEEVLAAYA